MIKSFASKETKAFFAGDTVKRYQAFAAAAERKLTLLDEAKALDDLKIPMGNKLEALRGDRNGQHSIRINQHTVCVSADRTATRMMWKSSIITKSGVIS
jgi:killer protein, putative